MGNTTLAGAGSGSEQGSSPRLVAGGVGQSCTQACAAGRGVCVGDGGPIPAALRDCDILRDHFGCEAGEWEQVWRGEASWVEVDGAAWLPPFPQAHRPEPDLRQRNRPSCKCQPGIPASSQPHIWTH